MSNYRVPAVVLIAASLVVIAPSLAADERLERLSEEHRAWLEQEVVYIISDVEREVFLGIETLEPRERFIEAFWRKRDPDPATVENEFRVEHYRRIDYANEYLGRETSIPGWKTDRGRYYIMLGEPQSVQEFVGYQELVSIQLWLYQGDTELGVPPFFNLLFFKPRNVGAYRLYRPMADGPYALLQSTFDIGVDPGPAIHVIERQSYELARATLTFDASESVDFTNARPSMASDIVLARVEELPTRSIRADYADAFLRYGDKVSADYSFNFIPNRATAAVLPGPNGSAFFHYAIEIAPEDFTIETDEDQTRFYTTLDVDIEARDRASQRVVFNASRELGVELTPSQFESARTSPYSIQDGFALVPGAYDVAVTLQNRVQTRFTVAEWSVGVPTRSDAPRLSEMLIGYEREHEEDDPARGRPFRIGAERINPAAEGTFATHETVYAWIQAFDAARHAIRFTLREGDRVLESRDVPLDGGNDATVQEFPLLAVKNGSYRLTAQLVTDAGQTVSERSVDVHVSPRRAIERPSFVYRRRFDTAPAAVALAEGELLFKLGRRDEAREALQHALTADPSLPPARWQLAALLIGTGETHRALELLSPLEQSHPNTFEVVVGLGLAHYFEQNFERARPHLERAITLRPPDPPLLNALADTYQRLGAIDKARETFERSLSLDTGQEEIRRRLDSLTQPDTAR